MPYSLTKKSNCIYCYTRHFAIEEATIVVINFGTLVQNLTRRAKNSPSPLKKVDFRLHLQPGTCSLQSTLTEGGGRGEQQRTPPGASVKLTSSEWYHMTALQLCLNEKERKCLTFSLRFSLPAWCKFIVLIFKINFLWFWPPEPENRFPRFSRKLSASGENEPHQVSSFTNTLLCAKYERNRFLNFCREIEILLDFYWTSLLKVSIIYDNVETKDCRHKRRSAYSRAWHLTAAPPSRSNCQLSIVDAFRAQRTVTTWRCTDQGSLHYFLPITTHNAHLTAASTKAFSSGDDA